MAHQFVRDLKEGVEIQQFLVVKRIETRLTKKGDPFLSLVLGDRTGTIKGKVWSDVLEKHPGPLTQGDYVGVTGRISSFNDELQLNVQFIMTLDQIRQRKKEVQDFDVTLLHPCTAYDRALMWQELLTMTQDHLDSPIKDLVLSLLQKYAEPFQVIAAARQNHHAYLGGLLEHTWFVARLAWQAVALYPSLNKDLVLAGAILHDFGKVQEISNPLVPEYTTAGQLLGHIVLGCAMVRQEAAALNFPDPVLLMQLEHIILSHHGYQEFGSPVLPKTREALVVYFMDDLDAKMKMMEQHLDLDTTEREFTGYHRLLQRELYKAVEQPGATVIPEDEPDN
jgi:3'-5' exoribonuclease